MFFRPINDLTEKYNILQSAMASSERLSQLMNTKAVVGDAENPVSVDRLDGRIEFKNVWFAYNEPDWVLKDINFTIEPGEVVAFVGATGAGKTSITSLINRLYDIQKGQLLIDGVDIRKYKVSDLRRNIAAVLQDVFLFTGDIKSNIRLNNEDIPDEKIREVAQHVNADHFISRLPRGYDEPVTERVRHCRPANASCLHSLEPWPLTLQYWCLTRQQRTSIPKLNCSYRMHCPS